MTRAPSKPAFFALAVALVPLALAHAQPPLKVGGNSARGRFVAIGTEFEQEPYPCVSCHGFDGTGDASGAFPRLTRQSESYLLQALSDFASGDRQSAIMKAVADSLADDDRRDVAAYFASTAPATEQDRHVGYGVQALARGRALVTMGDAQQGIAPCTSCHGDTGMPAPATYPYLAGQPAAYLEQSIDRFKSGERHGLLAAVMRPIAASLSSDDAVAVSKYYASLSLGSATSPSAGGSSRTTSNATPPIQGGGESSSEPPFAWPRGVAAQPAQRTVGATIDPQPGSGNVVLPEPFAAMKH